MSIYYPENSSDHVLLQFLREVWALYAIGVTTILLRFATRIKTVGFVGFQGDDYMNILVLMFYTVDAVTVNLICEIEEKHLFRKGSLLIVHRLYGIKCGSECSAGNKDADSGRDHRLRAWFKRAVNSLVFIYGFDLVFERIYAIFLPSFDVCIEPPFIMAC